jgi:urease accessory protein
MVVSGPAALLATLLLGDGRFPAGAHAHSLGLEAAVGADLVRDLDDLARWLEGQLHTTWTVDVAVALHAHVLAGEVVPAAAWWGLDVEVTARATSPQLRAVSRQLGRQLLRAAARAWPSAVLAELQDLHPDGPHVAVVQGAAGAAAGIGADATAAVVLHGAAQLATSAAVRLLGLDPYAVVGMLADLGPELASVASVQVAAVGDDPCRLPAVGAPATDLLLARHATADGRLFAS